MERLQPGEGFILFEVDQGNDNHAIVRVDANGVQPLTVNHGDWNDHDAEVSPDGRTIAFASSREDGIHDDLYLMSVDGSELRKLADLGDIVVVRTLSWSPDGIRLLFSAGHIDYSDIFVIQADGNHLTNLTQTAELYEYSPDWSIDGQEIIFSCSDEGVCVMNADGSGKRVVPKESAPTSLHAALPGNRSPDGKKIVFDRDDGIIYVRDIVSGSETRLARGCCPTWHW